MTSLEVRATADRLKMTENVCTAFVADITQAGKLDVKKAVSCRSTLREVRIQNREVVTKCIRGQ